jgi:hypothetical protein
MLNMLLQNDVFPFLLYIIYLRYNKNTLFGGVFCYGAEGGISFSTLYSILTVKLLQYIVVNKHLGTLSEYFSSNKALRLLARLYF